MFETLLAVAIVVAVASVFVALVAGRRADQAYDEARAVERDCQNEILETQHQLGSLRSDLDDLASHLNLRRFQRSPPPSTWERKL